MFQNEKPKLSRSPRLKKFMRNKKSKIVNKTKFKILKIVVICLQNNYCLLHIQIKNIIINKNQCKFSLKNTSELTS